MNLESLTKGQAIKNVVERATTEGHWKSSCLKDAMGWLQRSERNEHYRQLVRDFVDAEYERLGLDIHGKKRS